MNFYIISNKYENNICIEMNQQYNSIISLFIYNVLITIYLDIFKPILYIIKNKVYITTCVIYIYNFWPTI
jgi:hypothetical protein